MITKTVRIPEELEQAIARESRALGKSWSATAAELLEESLRTRRVPGIAFADGPAGRRAVIAGTGLDVWEVIATWQSGGSHPETLQQNYPWLTEAQRHSALAYYEAYPSEIDARLQREEQLTPERVWLEFPSLRPKEPLS
jgi:uncharacterized protein (DUF433 family)